MIFDPYRAAEYVPARVPSEGPPRDLIAGDLIAWPTDWKCAGPYRFVRMDGERFQVQTPITYDGRPMYIGWRVSEGHMEMGEWESWHLPSNAESLLAVTFPNGYGPAIGQWMFADDARVVSLSDMERQLLAVRNKPSSILKIAGGDGLTIPSCASCGEWPCKACDGCPDYARLAKYGWRVVEPKVVQKELFEEAA